MKYCVSLALCALAISFSACSLANPLDAALKEYTSWKTITVTTQQRGRITNVRTDGQYRALIQAFNNSPASDYPVLVKWVEAHQKEVPAPLYFDLASMALKEKRPNKEIWKWVFIGQTAGIYDAKRCRDPRVSGAFMELGYIHPDLANLYKSNRDLTLSVWADGLQWFKEHPYKASPMWICSQGLSSINYIGNQARPATYSELVIPENELPMNWKSYMEASAAALAAKSNPKRPH